jgi:hypothetical protein
MERRAIVPTAHLVLGILVIAAGVLFTLDNLNLIEAREYLRFWPIALIAFGVAQFLDSRTGPGRFSGLVVILAGTMILLNNLAVVHFRLRDYWPLLLVALGLTIIWRAFAHEQGTAGGSAPSMVSALAMLGGVNKVFRSQDFRGGELTALLGGCEVDLRPAGMQVDEATLNVFTFWGGIELKVPEDWIVVNQGIPILGGVGDRTVPREGAQKRLVIRGFAIMGGVEIRN